jgi:hypothetical protein
MIEAITTTNSGNPIGRWLDETKASALISVTLALLAGNAAFIDFAALHKLSSGMADARAAGRSRFGEEADRIASRGANLRPSALFVHPGSTQTTHVAQGPQKKRVP